MEHLEQVERSTGRQVLPAVEIPPEGEHIWQWFWQLSSKRGGGFGPGPLTYTEIQAWIGTTGTIVRPYEIDILNDMDGAYMRAQSDISRAQSKKGKK